jgi:enoyl-CoA hydratase/carnithine racemase
VPALTRDGDVFVLSLGDGENRFTLSAVAEINSLLDEVEASSGPAALVTVASGKIWSNGIDLDWLLGNPDDAAAYVGSIHAMLSRFLTFSVPAVAAIGGHVFAGGAMLALAHDQRVMRADRGYFCLPEVDLGIPFTVGMSALIQAKLTPAAAHEAMTAGRRYGGSAAAAAGIVDVAVAEDEVATVALDRAGALAPKRGSTFAAIKRRMYASVVAALAAPVDGL